MATKKPSLIHRLKSSISYFRTGLEPRNNTKKAPYTFGLYGGQPQWSLENYEEYYRSGYAKNSVINAAIMTKVRAMAQARLVASMGDMDEPETIDDLEHPLVLLTKRPNPYQSGKEFQQLQTVYLNTTGNAFTYLFREKKNDLPTEMWAINPRNIQIVVDDETRKLVGYVYHPVGIGGGQALPIPAYDMMHVKFPNPLDPYEGLGFGLSPIAPMAQSADVDNEITRFLKLFFQHGGMALGALKLKDMTLDEDAIKEVKEVWSKAYGGVDNWNDIAVLDSTMEYQKIGLSFNEMEFESLDSRNESRILLPLGVPAEILPVKLGLEGSTFANKAEARKWFWEDTMTYEMELFLDEYQLYLGTDDGAFVRFDTSKVAALKQEITPLVDSAQKLWTIGVPAKIAFKTVGLQIEDYPGNDIGFLPFNVLPVASNGKPEQPALPDGTKPDGTENTDTEDIDETIEDENAQNKVKKNYSLEMQSLHYKNFDRIVTTHEKPFSNAANRCFEFEKANVLAIVHDAKKKSLELKASIDTLHIRDDIQAFLFGRNRENWRSEFTPVMTMVVEDTSKYWSNQLGITFDLRNIEGEAWFTDYVTVFANPITETSNEVIHDVIAQAFEEGWGNDVLANRLDDIYNVWQTGNIDPVDFAWLNNPAANPALGNRMLRWRQEMIARTETTRAANAGANNLFGLWGVRLKQWLSTGDERTRESHVLMNGQVQKVSDKFLTGAGNELLYPGDPSAPLSDTIQCRCTILPVIDR